MAQIEVLLVTRLKADGAVAALVGGRVHPDRLPQGTTYPALRYVMVDRVEVLAKPGSLALRIVRASVQLDCYAATYGQAKALAAAVKGSMYGWQDGANGVIQARVTDERDGDDAEETMQRVIVDASITYNE